MVCLFLEPIALYHTRDLHDDDDEQWLATYPAAGVAIGRARTYGDGADVTILTFGNGLRMSLRVARRLASDRHRCARRRPAMAGAAAGRGHAPRGRMPPAGC